MIRRQFLDASIAIPTAHFQRKSLPLVWKPVVREWLTAKDVVPMVRHVNGAKANVADPMVHREKVENELKVVVAGPMVRHVKVENVAKGGLLVMVVHAAAKVGRWGHLQAARHL